MNKESKLKNNYKKFLSKINILAKDYYKLLWIIQSLVNNFL
jgi:hypothetical protein